MCDRLEELTWTRSAGRMYSSGKNPEKGASAPGAAFSTRAIFRSTPISDPSGLKPLKTPSYSVPSLTCSQASASRNACLRRGGATALYFLECALCTRSAAQSEASGPHGDSTAGRKQGRWWSSQHTASATREAALSTRGTTQNGLRGTRCTTFSEVRFRKHASWTRTSTCNWTS